MTNTLSLNGDTTNGVKGEEEKTLALIIIFILETVTDLKY